MDMESKNIVMMAENDLYWIFANNNKYSKSKYTREEAVNLNETLKGCSECIDCIQCCNCRNLIDCVNCIACASSERLKSCNGCSHCTLCRECTDCTHCNNCVRCEKCNKCESCNDCNECNYCISCKKCEVCYRCETSTSCVWSEDCKYCEDSRFLYKCIHTCDCSHCYYMNDGFDDVNYIDMERAIGDEPLEEPSGKTAVYKPSYTYEYMYSSIGNPATDTMNITRSRYILNISKYRDAQHAGFTGLDYRLGEFCFAFTIKVYPTYTNILLMFKPDNNAKVVGDIIGKFVMNLTIESLYGV